MRDEIQNYLLGVVPNSKKDKTNLRYCLDCSYVWEEFYGMHRGIQCKKHPNMPTYKLERKTCFVCEAEQEGIQ
jgi:hypothetical protein